VDVGDTPQNRQALAWLRSKVRNDGSFVEPDGKTASSLSVAMLGMAAAALLQPEPATSFRWLTNHSLRLRHRRRS